MDRNSSFKKTSLARILNSIPYDNGFHFYHGIGNYTGVTATSLAEFAEKLQIIDVNSIRFHFQRGDFQKWIKDTIGDAELVKRMNMLNGDLPEEDLRRQLFKLVQTRINELKTFI